MQPPDLLFYVVGYRGKEQRLIKANQDGFFLHAVVDCLHEEQQFVAHLEKCRSELGLLRQDGFEVEFSKGQMTRFIEQDAAADLGKERVRMRLHQDAVEMASQDITQQNAPEPLYLVARFE